MNDPRSIKLQILADLQCYVSRQLGELFEATRNRDVVLLSELNRALENSDKFIVILRKLAEIADRATPKSFTQQEAETIDVLTKSHKLIADRNGLKLVRNDVDDINYLGGDLA